MSRRRILALVKQDFYMTRREPTLWADLFFFSIVNVLVFGLLARQFSRDNPDAGLFVLSGMLLWEVIRLCQYTITVTSLWNVWSHNLANIFLSPVSLAEYVAGNVLSAAAKTVVTLVPLVAIVAVVFDFSLLSVGLVPLLLAVLSLMLFAAALGLVLLGLVFRYGVRVQALAWSAVYLFQPLIGVYFPLDVLPRPVQWVATAVPATHAFAAIRNSLDGTGSVYGLLLLSLGMGVAAFGGCTLAFVALHRGALVSGQLARNDL